MHVQEMRTSKLKRFMAAETFAMELELHRVDCESSNGFRDNYDFLLRRREEYANEPLIPAPLISGKDLMAKFNLPSGPKIGEILRAVQNEQLEGRLVDKSGAFDFIQERFSL